MILTSTLLTGALLAAPIDDSCSSQKVVKSCSTESRQSSIVEAALANDAFSTLVTALKAADLVEPLQGKGPFTVFAPTNEAFAQLAPEQLHSLLKPENKHLLRSILTYHVAPGALSAEKVVGSPFATTLNGQRIDFSVDDSGARVDSARITKTDIHCSNGIIHVIDRVILPSTIDVVTTAVEAGSFKTLATALKAAALVEALQGEGPFTVFAPTDEAFGMLPEGTVADLVKPHNREKLTQILTYHVVPGRLYAEDLAASHEWNTLAGSHLAIQARGEQVLVGDARVINANVEASNGVIHVIDRVLMPK